MKQCLMKFYEEIGRRKPFYILLAFITILSYGFIIFNRTTDIDCLSDSYYYNPRMMSSVVAGRRWFLQIIKWILGDRLGGTAFITPYVAVILMVIAAYLLCALLYLIKPIQNVLVYATVATAFISFPLINETFEYKPNPISVAINFCLAFLAVIFHITYNSKALKKTVIEALMLVPIASGYEAGLFAYVTLVLLVLCLKFEFEEKDYRVKDYFREGITYAIPVIIAVIIKYTVGYIWASLYNVEDGAIGATQISWNVNSLISSIKADIYLYFVKGFTYFPITIFVVATVITFLAMLLMRRRMIIILFYCVALLSCFSLTFLQAAGMPYRAAQTITVFTVISIYLLLYFAYNRLPKNACVVVIGLLLLCVFRQSVYLSEIFALDNQRSDNEAFLARTIGYKITTEYDSSKPIIFAGSYYLGNYLYDGISVKNERIVRIDNRFRDLLGMDQGDKVWTVDTNVQSYLSWGVRAIGIKDLEVLRWYFEYYGYDLNIVSALPLEEKEEIEAHLIDYPTGITDTDKYIIVKLGE